jgi:transcriptional regulator with XRE-family HTH domain
MEPPARQLENLGATIRSARVARGLTQQQVAEGARVSRAQLAELERGANVSVLFLLKIANFLGLTHLALDGVVHLATAGEEGLDVSRLLQLTDVASAAVDELRLSVMNAALPVSERKRLVDTPAVKAFIERHVGESAGAERLAEALANLSEAGSNRRAPKPAAASAPERRAAKRRG